MEWISSENKPEEDRHLILYIQENDNDKWWRVVNGSYQNDKFYAQGGISYSNESVLFWQYLNKPI